ncbi:MAG: SDR family NAD(P)-dependent oxidoreductase [Halodesulfurarchaeum sp.]
MVSLTDEVAVVTGGSSGIGRQPAETLADRGAKVVAWLLSDEASFVTDEALGIDRGYLSQ